MRFLPARAALLPALAALLALLPFAAAAHEQRDTPSGQYSLEVGFRDEPAYLNQENAVFLAVTKYGTGGGPVEGLAGTLTVEVGKDGLTKTFNFLPRAEPGEYEAVFIPTSLGDYTFRVVGQIDGEAVDETFRSSPNTFAAVEPSAALQFPVELPDPATVGEQAQNAEDDASRAGALGLAGLAAGVLGIVIGLVALLRARRLPAAPTVAVPSGPEATVEAPAVLVEREARERPGGAPPPAGDAG